MDPISREVGIRVLSLTNKKGFGSKKVLMQNSRLG